MRARRAAIALLGVLGLGAPASASAKDLLDYVIEAVDPTLAPARPLIECLAGGGDAVACAAQAAKKKAAGALPVGPGDERVKKAAAVFAAARDERWLAVVKLAGEGVAQTVACAVVPVQGPLRGTACGIIGWAVAKNAGALDKAYQALKGADWWALVELLGPGACELIPGEGAAGFAKELLCGSLAAALAEAKKWANAVGGAVVAGADAIENVVFGDDSHMPYDRYFALYWQPWYHYSTARLLQGGGIGPALDGVHSACVDYFDSHNQYRSTAKKTCGDLRSRFRGHVQGFADALPVAVDGHFETAVRPAARAFAVSTYGKPASGGPPPGEDLFVQTCVFQMRMRVPFPEPDDRRCDVLAEKARTMGTVGGFDLREVYAKLEKSCRSNVKLQDVQPTAWETACEEVRPRYRQAIAGEALWMLGAIGRLKVRGCMPPAPGTAQKTGLVMTCSDHAAYSACRGEFHPNGEKRCRLDVPMVRASDMGPLQVGAGGAATGVAVGPVDAAPPAGRPAPEGPLRVPPSVVGAMRRPPAAVVVEAEALVRSGRLQIQGGQAVEQPMAGFGPGWGGDAQLLWHGGAVGAVLDLLVDVPKAATWAVEVDLTRAPDYARVRFEVDGHAVAERFDGYAERVSGPIAATLGTFALQPGARRVTLMIIGRDPASTGWLVGVDRVRLREVGSP